MSDKEYIYDAFISYRHNELDKFVVDNLHKMLETYKVPRNLKGGKKEKIKRVFRDRDELPTSGDLASSIKEALEVSEYLIVVCSPRLPESKWCIEEIKTFSKLHGHDKILALLIEGEPYESFPKELTNRIIIEVDEDGKEIEKLVEVEPLAADIRGKDKKEILKLLKSEKLRLLAPILGCKYDDLKQRHRERYIKKVISLTAIITTIVLSFGAVSTWQAIKLKRQIDETLIGQSRYLSDISKKNLEEGDRRTAVLLALEGLPKIGDLKDRPYVSETEFALTKALGAYKLRESFMGDVALKHSKNIVGFDSTKEKVLTTTLDGDIYIWHDDKQQKNTIIHSGSSLGDLSAFLSQDGSIVIGAKKGGIAAWDSERGVELWNKKTTVSKINISEKRSKLAYGDNSVTVVGAIDGKLIYNYDLNSKDSYINFLCFSKDEKYLAVGTNEGKVILLDESGREVFKANTTYSSVKEICFNKDNSKLMVVSNDVNKNIAFDSGKGSIQLMSTTNGEIQKSYNCDAANISNVSFSKVNENKITFAEANNCKVYDISEGKLLNTLGSGDKVSSINVSDDDSLIVTASYDGTVRFFQMQSGKEMDWLRIITDYRISKIKFGNGKMLILPGTNKNLYVWKLINDEDIKVSKKEIGFITKANITKDNKNIIAINDNCISILNKDNKELKFKIDKDNKKIICYKELNDKLIVVTQNSLTSFDMNDGRKIESLELKDISKAIFTNDGSQVVIFDDSNIIVVDCSTLKEINKESFNGAIKDFNISDDNAKILVQKYDNSMNVLKLKDLKPIIKDEVIVEGASSISKNGELVAFTKGDEVNIYDTKSSKVITMIKDIKINVNKLVFSKDNKSIIACLDNKDIKIYDVKTGNLKNDSLEIGIVDDIKFTDKNMFVISQGKAIKYNLSDYVATAEIDGFLDISNDGKEILLQSNGKLGIANNYSLEELLNKAKKTVGETSLSSEEKRKYYIEK